MSVIDYTIHIFKCEICGVVEQVKINDYGNEFNGSTWQFGPKLNKIYGIIVENRQINAIEIGN